MKLKIPKGSNGDTLKFEIEALGGPMMPKAFYLYEFKAVAEPSTPEDADALVQMEAKEPKPKPLEPPMDNEPPKPGDIVIIEPGPVAPPQPPRPRRVGEKWYVHPEGDYRIALPQEWNLDKDGSDEETDMLAPVDYSKIVFLRQGFRQGREKA